MNTLQDVVLFSGIKCKDGKVDSDSNWDKSMRPKRDQGKVDDTRKDHRKKLFDDLVNQKHSDPNGEANRIMSGLAALHNPDMIAGGTDSFDKNSAISIGDKSVNSSIGSQWKGRISELDAEACKAKKEGKGKDKMNTELSRCPKK